MSMSVFDLFKVGIGPSSSHTVGPMRAGERFLKTLLEKNLIEKVASVTVELYGSLALTGIGHGTDKAIMLGLSGELPDTIDPESIDAKLDKIRSEEKLFLAGKYAIHFEPKKHLVFLRRKLLPLHSNGMRFIAFDRDYTEIYSRVYYSIGGGFVVDEETAAKDKLSNEVVKVKYPFESAAELLAICKREGLTIAQLMLANEVCLRTEKDVLDGIDFIWQTMKDCIDRGCRSPGILPGKLKVKRRAPNLYLDLTKNPQKSLRDPLSILDWVNLYALAVNEENAAGSRVVTAPTNGAAGIIPAVLKYFEEFCPSADRAGVHRFLLTAAAIGVLYTKNASISGAEVGCQGEVGVACSMAAGGLTAAVGGTNAQIEEAAEIGMEHNLGLTCDPIGGLVQIPCIERNAMGAVKAINANRIAMKREGEHHVSLDSVIATMRATGADMKTKYKETSRGGLAVNVIEC
ncbi:MAG: L-serine ammonia-lyase [Proteobacteria bacterium]|nr:MAG: L-serine ammonia-lyase [Pseudomonadota bacterium]